MNDWSWWILGTIAGLAGPWMLFRGMFADRSRGRRRCPKCWYLMEGTTERRCPECGREAASDRRLFRTRRHWRRAVIGMILIVISGSAFCGRQVQRHGWIGAVPSAAYILALPHLDLRTTYPELTGRIEKGDLRAWEYRLLVWRGLGLLSDETDVNQLVRVLRLLRRVENLGRDQERGRPSALGKSWARVSDLDRKGAIDVLLAMIEHEDVNVRLAAYSVLQSFDGNARAAIPRLVSRMDDEGRSTLRSVESALYAASSNARGERAPCLDYPGRLLDADRSWTSYVPDELAFYESLRRCGANTDKALAIFVTGLISDSEQVRVMSVFGAGLFGNEDETIRSRVLDLGDDPAARVRLTVAEATSRFPLDAGTVETLRHALRDGDLEVQLAAAGAIEWHGPAAAMFLDDLAGAMGPGNEPTLAWFARAHAAVSGDGDVGANALLDAAIALGVAWTLRAIADLERDAPRARDRIEPLLAFPDPDVRFAAAFAFVMCGGDAAESTRIAIRAASAGRAVPQTLYELAIRNRLDRSVVLESLDSPVAAERAMAAWAAGQIGLTEALPKLRQLTTDPALNVSTAAGQAVKMLIE